MVPSSLSLHTTGSILGIAALGHGVTTALSCVITTYQEMVIIITRTY